MLGNAPQLVWAPVKVTTDQDGTSYSHAGECTPTCAGPLRAQIHASNCGGRGIRDWAIEALEDMNGSSCHTWPPNSGGSAVFAGWGLHPSFVGPHCVGSARLPKHKRHEVREPIHRPHVANAAPSISPTGECSPACVGPRLGKRRPNNARWKHPQYFASGGAHPIRCGTPLSEAKLAAEMQ